MEQIFHNLICQPVSCTTDNGDTIYFYNITFETAEGTKGDFCTGSVDDKNISVDEVFEDSLANAIESGVDEGLALAVLGSEVVREAIALK